jgi:hypothetical protein
MTLISEHEKSPWMLTSRRMHQTVQDPDSNSHISAERCERNPFIHQGLRAVAGAHSRFVWGQEFYWRVTGVGGWGGV